MHGHDHIIYSLEIPYKFPYINSNQSAYIETDTHASLHIYEKFYILYLFPTLILLLWDGISIKFYIFFSKIIKNI